MKLITLETIIATVTQAGMERIVALCWKLTALMELIMIKVRRVDYLFIFFLKSQLIFCLESRLLDLLTYQLTYGNPINLRVLIN